MKNKLLIFITLAVIASILLSFGDQQIGEEPQVANHTEKAEKAKEKTYLVACAYKRPGLPESIVTVKVTTAYYTTDGQDFLDAVIRDLKEVGLIPADEYFDRPTQSYLKIVSIEPIPADVVTSTADPFYDPKVPESPTGNQDK